MKKTVIAAITLTIGIFVLVGLYLYQKGANSIDSRESQTASIEEPFENVKNSRNNKRTRALSLSASLIDEKTRWEVRVDRVRNLDVSGLSSEHVDALFALLDHEPSQTSQKQEDWWIVLNEIMEQLRQEPTLHTRYTEAMLSLINDSSKHEVVRDYAIQHLGLTLMSNSEKSVEKHFFEEQELESIFDSFISVITEPSLQQGSVPGTTLTLLTHLKNEEVAREHIMRTITTIEPWLSKTVSGENNTSLPTQATAINATSELGLLHFTPTIRDLAFSENEDINIRLNAIAAMGQLGDNQDIDSLNKIINSPSKLRFAAKSALKNLRN